MIRLPGADSWILDLVIEHYVSYAELKSGVVTLFDLVRLSDAHCVGIENSIRIREHCENREKNKDAGR